MKLNEVIISPLLTEKATNATKDKVYSFVVSQKANKSQIKEALKSIYQVKVGEVKIIVRKGKERRVGRRMTTKKLANKKIARVEVLEGKIDIFPQS